MIFIKHSWSKKSVAKFYFQVKEGRYLVVQNEAKKLFHVGSLSMRRRQGSLKAANNNTITNKPSATDGVVIAISTYPPYHLLQISLHVTIDCIFTFL